MPRILPRLLDALARAQSKPPAPARIPPGAYKRRLRQSLLKPVPPTPSFSPHRRTQSVVLDEHNPIAQPREYRPHKAQPPNIRLFRHESGGRIVKGKAYNEYDPPRTMTEEERRWYSNPYLRMLASPLRKCILTGRYLPTDLLIRLTTVRPSAARLAPRDLGLLVPDGLAHPKWRARRSGKGVYLVCARASIDQLANRSHELARFGAPHAHLALQIAHLLRTRVLHELAQLAAHLSHHPQAAASSPVLRRLTRGELAAIRAGTAPLPKGALALLVVPPVNRDPATKERPAAHVEETPVPEDVRPPPKSAVLPLSVLMSATPREDLGDAAGVGVPLHAEHRVPLYNGATLYPARAQRAALYDGLCRVLAVERRARRKEGWSETGGRVENERARGDAKGSHAFVLCADEDSIGRADAVPLAIALWRLRMWEGDAWQSGLAPWDISSLS